MCHDGDFDVKMEENWMNYFINEEIAENGGELDELFY